MQGISSLVSLCEFRLLRNLAAPGGGVGAIHVLFFSPCFCKLMAALSTLILGY